MVAEPLELAVPVLLDLIDTVEVEDPVAVDDARAVVDPVMVIGSDELPFKDREVVELPVPVLDGRILFVAVGDDDVDLEDLDDMVIVAVAVPDLLSWADAVAVRVGTIVRVEEGEPVAVFEPVVESDSLADVVPDFELIAVLVEYFVGIAVRDDIGVMDGPGE